MGRPATDKRERLVAAAMQRFHQHGYARTSLADVAAAAGIAPGNVFYYFKAKDDLARAVLDEWCRQLTTFMAAFDAEADRWLRLERFVEQAGVLRDMYVSLGCPLAGLSRDLRREAALCAELPRIYAIQQQWAEAQFTDLGFPPGDAQEHARTLMSGYHGAVLLAYAQDDDSLITSGMSSLKGWLRQIRSRGPSAAGHPLAVGQW